VEALKFGFAFRTEIADPDFVPIQDRLDEIITKDWAEIVRKNITDVSNYYIEVTE
jgi:gamma-glutamyltranspeptidase/glutathione hydrolase/leukotriene-C4 hydrolase